MLKRIAGLTRYRTGAHFTLRLRKTFGYFTARHAAAIGAMHRLGKNDISAWPAGEGLAV